MLEEKIHFIKNNSVKAQLSHDNTSQGSGVVTHRGWRRVTEGNTQWETRGQQRVTPWLGTRLSPVKHVRNVIPTKGRMHLGSMAVF